METALEFRKEEITSIIYNDTIIGQINKRGGYKIILFKEFTKSNGEIVIVGMNSLENTQSMLTEKFLNDNIK
jgi:hypothetical protein